MIVDRKPRNPIDRIGDNSTSLTELPHMQLLGIQTLAYWARISTSASGFKISSTANAATAH